MGFRATMAAASRHFRTNHSCRLAPAHQGMKMGMVVGSELVLICRTDPHPSGFPPAIGGYGTYLRGNDVRGTGLASARAEVCGHSRGRVTLFSYQSFIPAAAGTPRYENQSRGLVQRIGTADSATPHTDPCGGQALALHFPIPTPLDSGLRRSDDSGRHFRTNRSCRLWPAHQGIRMGSVEGGDLVLTCRTHPRPSGFRPARE